MPEPVTMLSIQDVISLFLAICGGIGVLGSALVYICKAIGWIRKPEEKQNEVLGDHEKRIADLERKIDKDYRHLKDLDETMKLILEAQGALLDHALDGNHTSSIAKSKQDIDAHLRSKIGGDY
jgi:hypothetical protein